MRPRVTCHMMSSVDGGIHPSGYSASPDGNGDGWSGVYDRLHEGFDAQGWLVGRVTMAEMAKDKPHPRAVTVAPVRPVRRAAGATAPYAIAVDASGKLHFERADIGGDHVIVLLGGQVSDEHLAELAADGISYIVTGDQTLDLAKSLETLATEFGVERLLIEGGGVVNGSFFAAGLIDELSVVIAPALDGREAAGRITTVEHGLADRVELSLRSCEQLAGGAVQLLYAVTTSRGQKVS